MLKVCVYLPPPSHGPVFSASVCSRLLSRFKKHIEVTEINEKTSDVASVLKKTDVLISEPALIYEKLEHLNNVKWVHSIWAGVNELNELPIPPKFILTRHAGSYGQLMAEYVVAQMVSRERDFFKVHRNQLNLKWCPQLNSPRMLNQLSIGILGVGEIGSKIAEFCKAFGMTVWGLSRTSTNKNPHIDHHRQQEGLSELLANCDYVCSVLPSTSSTKGLLNGDKLSSCANKKSVFINIGRGDVISEDTIIAAIKKGWLSGAILDVFEEEPLPEDSELWRMSEVTITPHIAGLCPKDESVEAFVANLELFLEEKDMKHVVDWTRGY